MSKELSGLNTELRKLDGQKLGEEMARRVNAVDTSSEEHARLMRCFKDGHPEMLKFVAFADRFYRQQCAEDEATVTAEEQYIADTESDDERMSEFAWGVLWTLMTLTGVADDAELAALRREHGIS